MLNIVLRAKQREIASIESNLANVKHDLARLIDENLENNKHKKTVEKELDALRRTKLQFESVIFNRFVKYSVT